MEAIILELRCWEGCVIAAGKYNGRKDARMRRDWVLYMRGTLEKARMVKVQDSAG